MLPKTKGLWQTNLGFGLPNKSLVASQTLRFTGIIFVVQLNSSQDNGALKDDHDLLMVISQEEALSHSS